MLILKPDIAELAVRLAAQQGIPVNEAIERAIQASAIVTGVMTEPKRRRRMSVDQMLAMGAEIVAVPLVDSRSPQEIMDELNTL